jgi:hypothetical protein
MPKEGLLFFEKKKQKTFICFGLGFSGWAQLK